MIVYHATVAVPVGEAYHGSDREKLSALLGGPVGFAYLQDVFGPSAAVVMEVVLEDDCPVVLSLDEEWDIPRRDYAGVTFEAVLLGGQFFVGRACELAAFIGMGNLGEVVFLAEKARFGRRKGGPGAQPSGQGPSSFG